MSYYVIPLEVIQNISHLICENLLDNYLSAEDLGKLRTLNADQIHSNKDDVIDEYERLFGNAVQELESTSDHEEEPHFDILDNLYEIQEALKKRKEAIKHITMDVLRKREECCCY
jgi:hypothetical protein